MLLCSCQAVSVVLLFGIVLANGSNGKKENAERRKTVHAMYLSLTSL